MQRRLAFSERLPGGHLTLLMTGLGLAGIGEDEALPPPPSLASSTRSPSYLVSSLFLLGAMVFYADSRDRPFAPDGYAGGWAGRAVRAHGRIGGCPRGGAAMFWPSPLESSGSSRSPRQPVWRCSSDC